MRFAGAVLTGGRSTRMGTDKALLEVGGRPLARIAVDALRDAAATEVVAVGGDRAALETMGLHWVADRWPGEGPLGGVITALGATRDDVVAVLACDLPLVTAAAVSQVVEGLGRADVAVAADGERVHPLLAAYRRVSVAALDAAFARGVRALRPALDGLAVVRVELEDPAWAANANRPHELRVTNRPFRS